MFEHQYIEGGGGMGILGGGQRTVETNLNLFLEYEKFLWFLVKLLLLLSVEIPKKCLKQTNNTFLKK